MRSLVVFATVFWLGACLAAQSSQSDEGTHLLALDNSWNRALEKNDTKALDLLLADTFVSIDIDGSIQNKREFLASLKEPGYEAPSQAVTEQSKVDVYGDFAVVFGIYRSQFQHEGKPITRRERFVDTRANINHIWKYVASVAVLIPAKCRFCLVRFS